MAEILEVKTVVETKSAEKSVQDLEEGIEGAGEATNQLTGSLDKMTGGAITAFKGIVKGVKSGVTAMRTLKGAIAATGVGLLVVAVGTLVSYFKNTQKGADLLDQAFATIGATIDVLVDRISAFGEGLLAIFSGNPSEGLDKIANSFKGIVDEIKNESAAALQLEKDFQALEKRRIDFIVTETKLRAEIEASNLAADDFTKSVEERAAANENAIKVEKQLAEERIAQTTEELRILTAKNKLGESMNEDIEAQRVLEARLFEIETNRDKKLKAMLAKQKSITSELNKQGEIRPETGMLEPLEKMEAAPLLSPEGEVRLSQEEHLLSLLKTSNEIFQKEKVGIDIASAKFSADQEELIQQQKHESIMKMTQLGFDIASTLAKKGSKEAKAIAVGQVLFDTYRGIQSAFAQTTDVSPTQTMRFINAASAAVFGFANVRKILSTPTTGGGGGSAPSVSTGGGARPSTEVPRIPNFDAMNQGVGGRDGFGSVRAVVIQQDIKDSASLDNRVDDLVKIGK